ncbi:hypothetical protein AGLY_010399 [Aphis glycines]|uniref:Uncharacterized protein n=1 Tax=Aphis glycines TaxID=307491 RepID=A0A6G0TFN9_APHGL|nr:hypothetical protein AGLY_010399 [Aphis glycines]
MPISRGRSNLHNDSPECMLDNSINFDRHTEYIDYFFGKQLSTGTVLIDISKAKIEFGTVDTFLKQTTSITHLMMQYRPHINSDQKDFTKFLMDYTLCHRQALSSGRYSVMFLYLNKNCKLKWILSGVGHDNLKLVKNTQDKFIFYIACVDRRLESTTTKIMNEASMPKKKNVNVGTVPQPCGDLNESNNGNNTNNEGHEIEPNDTQEGHVNMPNGPNVDVGNTLFETNKMSGLAEL